MPPKNKFSKEQIIEVAFNIAKEEGFDGITIRKVAEKLNSSVAPIYVNFSDIDDLKRAVVDKVYEIINLIVKAQNTGDIFLNIGIASIKFAKEYSILFKDLVLKSNSYLGNYDEEVGAAIIEQMRKDSSLTIFNEDELKEILLKMRVFQAGLSMMATNKAFASELTEEKIIELLGKTGEDIMNGMIVRKNKEGR